MGKREADTFLTKANDGSTSAVDKFDMSDAPQKATAAQLAQRKLAKPKGRRVPGAASSFPPSNFSGGFGQEQMAAGNNPFGGISFSQPQPENTGFQFNAAPTAFNFGSGANASANGGFTFGASQPPAAVSTPAGNNMFGASAGPNGNFSFAFGQQSQAPQQPQTSTFGFGTPQSVNPQTSQPSTNGLFNFNGGQSQPQQQPTQQPAFSFGVTQSQTPALTFGSSLNQPSQATSQSEKPLFGFGVSQGGITPSVTQSQQPAFSFGTPTTGSQSAPSSFSFGQTASSQPAPSMFGTQSTATPSTAAAATGSATPFGLFGKIQEKPAESVPAFQPAPKQGEDANAVKPALEIQGSTTTSEQSRPSLFALQRSAQTPSTPFSFGLQTTAPSATSTSVGTTAGGLLANAPQPSSTDVSKAQTLSEQPFKFQFGQTPASTPAKPNETSAFNPVPNLFASVASTPAATTTADPARAQALQTPKPFIAEDRPQSGADKSALKPNPFANLQQNAAATPQNLGLGNSILQKPAQVLQNQTPSLFNAPNAAASTPKPATSKPATSLFNFSSVNASSTVAASPTPSLFSSQLNTTAPPSQTALPAFTPSSTPAAPSSSLFGHTTNTTSFTAGDSAASQKLLHEAFMLPTEIPDSLEEADAKEFVRLVRLCHLYLAQKRSQQRSAKGKQLAADLRKKTIELNKTRIEKMINDGYSVKLDGIKRVPNDQLGRATKRMRTDEPAQTPQFISNNNAQKRKSLEADLMQTVSSPEKRLKPNETQAKPLSDILPNSNPSSKTASFLKSIVEQPNGVDSSSGFHASGAGLNMFAGEQHSSAPTFKFTPSTNTTTAGHSSLFKNTITPADSSSPFKPSTTLPATATTPGFGLHTPSSADRGSAAKASEVNANSPAPPASKPQSTGFQVPSFGTYDPSAGMKKFSKTAQKADDTDSDDSDEQASRAAIKKAAVKKTKMVDGKFIFVEDSPESKEKTSEPEVQQPLQPQPTKPLFSFGKSSLATNGAAPAGPLSDFMAINRSNTASPASSVGGRSVFDEPREDKERVQTGNIFSHLASATASTAGSNAGNDDDDDDDSGNESRSKGSLFIPNGTRNSILGGNRSGASTPSLFDRVSSEEKGKDTSASHAGSADKPGSGFDRSGASTPSLFDRVSREPNSSSNAGSLFNFGSTTPAAAPSTSLFNFAQAKMTPTTKSVDGSSTPFSFSFSDSRPSTPSALANPPITAGKKNDDNEDEAFSKDEQVDLMDLTSIKENKTVLLEVDEITAKTVNKETKSWTTAGVGPFLVTKDEEKGDSFLTMKIRPSGRFLFHMKVLPIGGYKRMGKTSVSAPIIKNVGAGIETYALTFANAKAADEFLALAERLKEEAAAEKK